MTEIEKFVELKKYLFRRYKEESNVYAEADENGELINAAKASICSEIFWEIILLLINWTSRRQEISECRRRT